MDLPKIEELNKVPVCELGEFFMACCDKYVEAGYTERDSVYLVAQFYDISDKIVRVFYYNERKRKYGY